MAALFCNAGFARRLTQRSSDEQCRSAEGRHDPESVCAENRGWLLSCRVRRIDRRRRCCCRERDRPFVDLHADSDYRRALFATLVDRALRAATLGTP
jgi:hypothetical protein